MSSSSQSSSSVPSREAKQTRASACRRDLLANGIDLGRFGRRRLNRFVGQHLDYFQLMLGYDAAPSEIVALWRGTGDANRTGTDDAAASVAPGGGSGRRASR